MKFTEEQFSEALKTKITNNGKKNLCMSERTFKSNVKRIYERLEKFNDEELELNDAVTEYTPDFEDIEGNMRKDNSDFIKKWNKEHPENHDDQTKKDEKDGNQDETELQKLQKQVAALLKREEENTAMQKMDYYKADVKRLLGEKLKDFEQSNGWIERRLKGYAFNPEADKDELVEMLVEDFNADYSGIEPSDTPKKTSRAQENQEHQFDDIVARLSE